jgi:Protein of unknown function (DUF2815)
MNKKAGKSKSAVITPVFRVSYPALFTPRVNMRGKEMYSVVMLFDKKTTDLHPIKKLIIEAAAGYWGTKSTGVINYPKNFRSPIRDGVEKTKDAEGKSLPELAFYADVWIVSASSLVKPGVVDQYNQIVINPADVYAGCYARAQVDAFTYDVNGNCGVSFGLINLRKEKDGDRLGGHRMSAEDAFRPLAEAVDYPAAEAVDYPDNDPMA